MNVRVDFYVTSKPSNPGRYGLIFDFLSLAFLNYQSIWTG